MSIGEIIRRKQPDVYRDLIQIKMFLNLEETTKNERHKEVKINDCEAEKLMRHDGYVRGRGGIRQTRRG